MKTLKLFAVLVSAMLLCLSATAADFVDLRNSGIKVDAQSFYSQDLTDILGLGGENELVLTREHTARTGIHHARYRQHYMGVPVWGEEVLVATDQNGAVYALNGRMVTGLELEVDGFAPAMDEKAALALAKELHHGDEKSFEARERIYSGEETNLVIYIHNGEPRLAYEVIFFSDVALGGDPTRPAYIIDAQTEDVLKYFDMLMTAEGRGPGGNQKFGRIYYGTDFPAFEVSQSGSTCRMQTANHYTRNLNHATSGGSIHSFTCSENTHKSINGAYSPLNDAHYGGGVTFQLYREWYNTSPLRQTLELRVHYGNNFENAFWDGSAMTFGDGGNTFHPLVSLDVVAHEASHGFTQQNSNLTYSGQSGGINEAFSDMAGKAAEYFDGSMNDWYIGGRIRKGSGAMRYMDNPPQDGRSIGCASDYRSGMDVHHSSGVFNKAFYHLATTPGWNVRKAFDVFVKANQSYWTASTNFTRGAEGAADAARELNYDCDDVVTAFRNVCVTISAPSGCTSTPTLDADFTYTTSGRTASFTDASTGSVSSYSWSFGDGNSSTSQNPSHTYRDEGTYTVSLTITGSNGVTDSVSKSVTVTDTSTGDTPLDNGVPVTLSATTGNWKWYKASVSTVAGSNLTVTTSGNNGDADLYVKYGSRPSENVYDGASTSPDSTEEVTIANPISGDYYIGVYAWSGFSNVTLTASWDGGTGGTDPNASFTSSVSGRTVSLTDTSTDDGLIVSWSWNFGDGNSSTAQNPSHTYAADGTYTVTLRVTDNTGATDTATASVTVGGTGGGTWAPYTPYAVGDVVTYGGSSYRCVIAHTSYPGWEPPNVPALWAPQ